MGLKRFMIISNTSYVLLELSPKEILVIFQTWERPDAYFKELVSDLKKYTLNVELYFDFLINNGLNDRFYSANFENGQLKINSFKKIKISNEYSKIANNYFAEHWELVEQISVLTNFQKSFLKKKFAIKDSSDTNNQNLKKV